MKSAAAFAVLAVAAATYTSVVSGAGRHSIGEPFTNERGAAILHWRYGVNQDVAACASPQIRAELGDQAFTQVDAETLSRNAPSTRFKELVAGCGHPGGVADKFWTLLIGFGAAMIVVITAFAVSSQPRLGTPEQRTGVRGRPPARPAPSGFEPGVIRGPLSGWR